MQSGIERRTPGRESAVVWPKDCGRSHWEARAFKGRMPHPFLPIPAPQFQRGGQAALGVVGAALAMLVTRFPTAGRLGAWLQRQRDALTALRNEAALSGR